MIDYRKGKIMKIIKKFLKSIVTVALVVSMSATPVLAAESVYSNIILSEEEANLGVMPAASSTIVAPDGRVYTHLATIDNRSIWKGTMQDTIAASDHVRLSFYCPNNNNTSLIQGTIRAREAVGTNVRNYSFLNRYNEISTIDFSTLPGVGKYIINITLDPIGTRDCDVYYRTDQF